MDGLIKKRQNAKNSFLEPNVTSQIYSIVMNKPIVVIEKVQQETI